MNRNAKQLVEEKEYRSLMILRHRKKGKECDHVKQELFRAGISNEKLERELASLKELTSEAVNESLDEKREQGIIVANLSDEVEDFERELEEYREGLAVWGQLDKAKQDNANLESARKEMTQNTLSSHHFFLPSFLTHRSSSPPSITSHIAGACAGIENKEVENRGEE